MHLEIRTVQKSSLPHPPTDKPRCSDGWVLSPSENRFPSMTPFLLRCKRILTWTLFHRAILYSLEADCSAYSALNPSGWRAAWIRYCERQGSLLLRMQLQRFPLGGPLKPRVNPERTKFQQCCIQCQEGSGQLQVQCLWLIQQTVKFLLHIRFT